MADRRVAIVAQSLDEHFEDLASEDALSVANCVIAALDADKPVVRDPNTGAPASALLQGLVESFARANHDFFFRRGQTRYAWNDLTPTIRHRALEAHLEIVCNGPADVVVKAINEAMEHAPVLRLRIEMFIAELKQREDIANTDDIADELQAVIDRPLED